MNLTRATITTYISRLLTAVASFIGIAWFARELGPTDLGSFFLFQAVIGVASVPINAGFGGGLVKRMSEHDEPSGYLLSAVVAVTSNWILASIFILALSQTLENLIGLSAPRLLLVVLIFREFYALTRNALKGELNISEAAVAGAIRGVTFVITGIILVLQGGGVRSLIYSLILSYVLGGVFSVWQLETSIGYPTLSKIKDLWSYSKYSVIAFIDSRLYNWLDIILIGFFLSQSAAGIYEIAWRVTTFIMLIPQSIETALLPQISSWDASGEYQSIKSVIPNAIIAGLAILIPATIGSIVIGTDLLSVVFGSEYAEGGLILIVLLFGRLAVGFDSVFRTVISGIDRIDVRAGAVVVSSILNLALNISLIPKLGIIGAAIGTSLAFVSSTLIIGVFVYKKTKFEFPSFQILWITISSIMMGILATILTNWIDASSIIGLISIILISISVYTLFLFIPESMRKMVYSFSNSING